MDQPTGTVIAAVIAVLGVIGTAVASTFAVVIKGRKDREIAGLKVGQDLLVEYDKDLRARRITCYEKLLSLMLPLAKYPEPQPLSYSKLKLLSNALRAWYFEGGGLYMSEETRDRYFDLQDGFKIVTQKKGDRWPLDAKDLERPGVLSEYLERSSPSPHVLEIARSELDSSGNYVPEEVYARLRSLGSSVRTSMTEDVLTRKGTYLRDVATGRTPE